MGAKVLFTRHFNVRFNVFIDDHPISLCHQFQEIHALALVKNHVSHQTCNKKDLSREMFVIQLTKVGNRTVQLAHVQVRVGHVGHADKLRIGHKLKTEPIRLYILSLMLIWKVQLVYVPPNSCRLAPAARICRLSSSCIVRLPSPAPCPASWMTERRL